jgi:hypothetical protein
MENPDNEDIIIQIEETLHLFLWPNNITTCFPFPVMFYLPCVDHVILFVDDAVTSRPQTKNIVSLCYGKIRSFVIYP